MTNLFQVTFGKKRNVEEKKQEKFSVRRLTIMCIILIRLHSNSGVEQTSDPKLQVVEWMMIQEMRIPAPLLLVILFSSF